MLNTVEKNDTLQLEAVVYPTDATNQAVSWSSSNPDVASVDADGTVTVTAPGKTVITAKTEDGGFTATREVECSGIALSKTSMTLLVNGSESLSFPCYGAASGKNVVWSSSNPSVADAAAGRITGHYPGTATVTAVVYGTGYAASCTVVVEEDVAFAPENLGVPPAEIRERVDDALRAVGMYEFREHAPHLLSGGQKQRVAIAGVIAMQPRCIVLDEPTAMLDPIGRSEVLRTIRDLNRKKGVTVVLITHHMDEAAQADRLVVMTKGRVIADGPPRQVFQDVEGLRSVGLTVPELPPAYPHAAHRSAHASCPFQ